MATGAYCEAVGLEPFDLEQTEKALRSYSEKVRTEIIALAKTNPKFRELVSRGSLLYVVSEFAGTRRPLKSERQNRLSYCHGSFHPQYLSTPSRQDRRIPRFHGAKHPRTRMLHERGSVLHGSEWASKSNCAGPVSHGCRAHI